MKNKKMVSTQIRNSFVAMFCIACLIVSCTLVSNFDDFKFEPDAGETDSDVGDKAPCETYPELCENQQTEPCKYMQCLPSDTEANEYGCILAHRENGLKAIEIYCLISRYSFVANSIWFEDVFGSHLEAATQRLPAEKVAAARERAQSMDVWQTVQDLLKSEPS